MNKVALKTIGLVEQNEVNDTWPAQQQEQQDQRFTIDAYLDGINRFRDFDQQQATMTEELVTDNSGDKYQQKLQFVVRDEYDRNLAKKYERRPLVVHVWTVDGQHYTLGTKSYPVYLVPSKSNSMDTVENSLTVEYETTTPIM
jgi:hypothetical protein